MAKRKKKKSKKRRQKERLKRRRRQLLAQRQAQEHGVKEEAKKPEAPAKGLPRRKAGRSTPDVKKTPKAKPKKETRDKSPERKMVIRDIRKFLWVFILIIAILIGIGLILSKTNWLEPVTDWIVNLTGK